MPSRARAVRAVIQDTSHHGSSATPGRGLVVAYMAITAVVLALLMTFGVVMRALQAGYVRAPSIYFYQLLTAHGFGMVAIAGLGGAAVMWHFLSRHVALSRGILLANLICFLLGLGLAFAGIFIGGFAAGWTFLFPLPVQSLGVWGIGATTAYLVGVLIVGVGFLVYYVDAGRAILARYGSPAAALGWRQAFRGSADEPPPPTVVASTVVTLINIPAIAAGAVVLTLSLVNAHAPRFGVDAFTAKTLTTFFDYVFVNSTVYMAVIAVYEILPAYTGRPWRTTRPFLIGWTATLLMLLVVYPYHLLMDDTTPMWLRTLAQVLSYASPLPVLAVTASATFASVHRSGMRWNVTVSLLFLSIMGWSVGAIPAVVDGTIAVNRVMHNTLWVPGHFHIYLTLGVVGMLFAFMYFLGVSSGASDNVLDRVGVWIYTVGALGFGGAFLAGGAMSVPRRWAVHLEPWMVWDRVGVVFGALLLVGAAVFGASFLWRVRAIDK